MPKSTTKKSNKRVLVTPDQVRSSKRGRQNDKDQQGGRRVEPGTGSTEAAAAAPQQPPIANEQQPPITEEPMSMLITKHLFSDNENVVEKALEEIANRCNHTKNPNSKENRVGVFSMGGHMLAIKAMKKFSQNQNIQAHGIRVLVNNTVGNNDFSDMIKSSILTLEGVAAIVAAMDECPGHEKIQEHGCLALWNIIEGKQEDNAADRLVAENGVEAIVKAMGAFHANARLQHYACRVLHIICKSSPGNKNRVAQARGVVAIATALADHPNAVDIQKASREVMTSLLW